MKNIRHEILDSCKAFNEHKNQLALEAENKINSKIALRESMKNNYYKALDRRRVADNTHAKLLEAARDNALSTVIKAIYITALEADMLTSNGLVLAENMVDTWISENGGATKILTGLSNKTYLISKITKIVEDAAEKEVAEIEKEEDKDDEEKEPTKKEKKEDAIDAAKEFIDTASKPELTDFLGKVVGSIQKKAEEKSEEKAEKKAEEEAQAAAEAPAEDDTTEEAPADDDDEMDMGDIELLYKETVDLLHDYLSKLDINEILK